MAGLITYTEISAEKVNDIIPTIDYTKGSVIYERGEDWMEKHPNKLSNIYVFHKIDNERYDYLSYRIGRIWHNYRIDKSEIKPYDYNAKIQNAAHIASAFCRAVDFERYNYDDDFDVISLGQYSYPNSKEAPKQNTIGKILHNIYGYDRHKAFLAACIDLQAPLKFIDYDMVPQANQVGFNTDGKPIYGPCDTLCHWVFTCGINQSLNKWAYKLIDKINHAKKEDLPALKAVANIAIGNLAKKEGRAWHNKFLRNAIVFRSNERTKRDMDENTIKCNTDSIVSLVPRPDLDLGPNVGQYGIENQGDFIMINEVAYQWNTGKVKAYNENAQHYWEKVNGRPFDLSKDDPAELKDYYPIYWDEKINRYKRRDFTYEA